MPVSSMSVFAERKRPTVLSEARVPPGSPVPFPLTTGINGISLLCRKKAAPWMSQPVVMFATAGHRRSDTKDATGWSRLRRGPRPGRRAWGFQCLYVTWSPSPASSPSHCDLGSLSTSPPFSPPQAPHSVLVFFFKMCQWFCQRKARVTATLIIAQI